MDNISMIMYPIIIRIWGIYSLIIPFGNPGKIGVILIYEVIPMINGKEICEAYNEGVSMRALARQTGYHPKTIKKILLNGGCYIPTKEPKPILVRPPLWQIKQACRLSVPQLAWLIGESNKCTEEWVWGNSMPQSYKICSIAAKLGLSPNKLLDPLYQVEPEEIEEIKRRLGRRDPKPIPEPVEYLSEEELGELMDEVEEKAGDLDER